MRTWAAVALAAAVPALLGNTSCSQPIPRWDGKIYAGSSREQGMVRTQEDPPEVIKASDPKFDELLGMTYADFESFYSTYVLGCKEWKGGAPMMTAQEALLKLRAVELKRATSMKGEPK